MSKTLTDLKREARAVLRARFSGTRHSVEWVWTFKGKTPTDRDTVTAYGILRVHGHEPVLIFADWFEGYPTRVESQSAFKWQALSRIDNSAPTKYGTARGQVPDPADYGVRV